MKTMISAFSVGLVFSLGWGLSGYCPGAGLVAAAGGALEPVVFTVALLAGFYLYKRQGTPAISDQPLREKP